MEKNLESAYSEVGRDLSTEWIALTQRVRILMAQVHTETPSGNTEILTDEIAKLCDHVDRMHRDVAELLAKMDENLSTSESPTTTVRPSEVDEEVIQIQRETHELRADFKDILKALFMWQEDPVERVRDKKSL